MHKNGVLGIGVWSHREVEGLSMHSFKVLVSSIVAFAIVISSAMGRLGGSH
jgi:hypothetical protein